MAVNYKDREALAEAVYQFIHTWLKEHKLSLTGDEVEKLLDVVGVRFINEYHAARKRRGLNKYGEYL